MMNLQIGINGGKVFDSFNHKNSTLQENAVVLRRLEEMKTELLNINYEDDLRVDDVDDEKGVEDGN